MINKFKSYLKIRRWWDSQLPVMMALMYIELSKAQTPPSVVSTMEILFLFLVASTGIASFGYLLNDLTDRDKDRQSGVHNLVSHSRRRKIVVMFAGVVLFSWVPWIWLPRSNAIIGLVSFEYLLFIAYSVAPIRLKERGIPGSLADALYGYTIPTTVSMLVFARFANVAVSGLQLALVLGWSTVVGTRNILIHQLKDAANDELAGTRTTVTIYGWSSVFQALERILLPVEMLLFLVVLVLFGAGNPLLPIGYAAYAAWTLYFHRRMSLWSNVNPFKMRAMDKVLFVPTVLMSQFQRYWFAALYLPLLVLRQHSYIVLVGLHFLLLENGFQLLFRYELPELRRIHRIHTLGGTY